MGDTLAESARNVANVGGMMFVGLGTEDGVRFSTELPRRPLPTRERDYLGELTASGAGVAVEISADPEN